jgi:hypothetical protein
MPDEKEPLEALAAAAEPEPEASLAESTATYRAHPDGQFTVFCSCGMKQGIGEPCLWKCSTCGATCEVK